MNVVMKMYLERPTMIQWMDLPTYYSMMWSIRRSIEDIKEGRVQTLGELCEELGIVVMI